MSKTSLKGVSAAEHEPIDDQDVEYEVEKLLAHSYLRGRKQFLVKWKGYPMDQSTWEPMEELDNCIASLMDYEEEDFIKIMKNTNKKRAKIRQKEELVPTYVMMNNKEYSPVYAEQEEFLGFDKESSSSSSQVKQEQVHLSDDESVGESISSVAHSEEDSQEASSIQAICNSKTSQEQEFLEEASLGFEETTASGTTTEEEKKESNSWLTVAQIQTQLRLDELLADLERTIRQEGLHLNVKKKKRGWKMPETSKTYGIGRCLQLEKIHNCFKVREQLFFCVTWKGCGTMDAVPLRCIKYLYPELIIQFLETLQKV
ncbi:chromo domain-containing protein rhino-like [Drosophila takahashii]|uniref:chromo domain-containing protein rhino-like n=1 Tax=Drosophila takahashii TaxID=29030 RepID=UPI001CF8D35E|nr:M-phase phosphoprotein 8-like [Drosophila takahashii]